jgi:drug/metabolite transporter (DMT)-like permease
MLKKSRIAGSGYVYVILAALCWAVSGSSAKFLFQQGISPFQLVQLRLTIAAAIIFLWLFIQDRFRLRIEKKDFLYFVILGAMGLASVQVTYLYAISKIHVAAAILLQYLAPAFIALYSVIFAHEKLSLPTISAVIGATAGCYLVSGAYNLDMLSMNKAGIISGILSAIAFAWYSIQGEYGMRRYDSWTVLFFALLFAAMSWNIFYPPFSAFMRPYSAVEWGWISYIAVFGTAVPFGLYLKGISLIRAANASITATLEPITAGIISSVFLGEKMDGLQMAGGGLVIFSIILLQITAPTQTFHKDTR